MAFAELVAGRGVLAIPGAAFAQPGHCRICFTATEAMLDRAIPVLASPIEQAWRG